MDSATPTKVEGGWDVLAIAVSAIDYYQSERDAFPNELGVRWFVDRHPCDDVPWMANVGFYDPAAD